jgi:glycosyltransferase involved in cell wall biosynthesis
MELEVRRPAIERALRLARQAVEDGRYEVAIQILTDPESVIPDSSTARDLRVRAQLRMGELTDALASMRVAIKFSASAIRYDRAQRLAARIVETNPRWLPAVGTAGQGPLAPRPGVVLHLLKESLPFYERGYTIRSQATLQSQLAAGLEPVVVTALGFPRDQGFAEFPLFEKIDGVPHHRLDLGPAYGAIGMAHDELLSHQATMVDRLAAEIRPEAIQASSGYHGFDGPLTGLAVGRSRNIPVIYEIRSFLEHTWTGNLDRSETGEHYRRRFGQETRCLLESDLVITIAETMVDDLVARGLPSDRVRVVPNVVDIDRFHSRPKPDRLADRLGLTGRSVLGYVSNIGMREGIEHLVGAVARLRGFGDDVAGLVVGEGPERAALEDLARELGVGDSVVFTGHVPNEDIEDHYALIDVFVVPRIDDRAARLVTPLKPLEAMAMGIPVVASDLPALRELVGEGDRGLLFEPGDVAGLARQAALLLGDAEQRRRLTVRARTWVAEERSIAANAVRYRAIFDELARGA